MLPLRRKLPLESASPQEIVGWAIATYRDKLTVATALAPRAAVCWR